MKLSAADERVVLDRAYELRQRAHRGGPASLGCAVAAAALVALVLMPVLTRALPFGSDGMLALGLAMAALVLAGTVVGLAGGRRLARAAAADAARGDGPEAEDARGYRRIDEALTRGDRPSALRAAVDAVWAGEAGQPPRHAPEAARVAPPPEEPAGPASDDARALRELVQRLLVDAREIPPRERGGAR